VSAALLQISRSVKQKSNVCVCVHVVGAQSSELSSGRDVNESGKSDAFCVLPADGTNVENVWSDNKRNKLTVNICALWQ